MDREQRLKRAQGDRLKAARVAAGYRSARAAALDNGWAESSYRAHEGGTRTIGVDDAEQYATRYRTKGVAASGKSILFGDQPLLDVSADRGITFVPRISWVGASQMRDVGDVSHPADVPKIAASDLPRGEWFALRVEGDSMDRVAPEGATILVNQSDKRLLPNRYYIFGIRGEATFKRYISEPVKRLEPFSWNPAHRPIYPSREIVVLGRVRRVIVDLP